MRHDDKAPTEIVFVKPRVRFDWNQDFPVRSSDAYAANTNRYHDHHNHRSKDADEGREDRIERLRKRRSKEPSKTVKEKKESNSYPLRQYKKPMEPTYDDREPPPPTITTTSPKQIYRIVKPQSNAPIKYIINPALPKKNLKNVGLTPQDLLQRRVVYRRFGNLSTDHIRVEELPDAVLPRDDYHVVVKILASTVSVEDCILRRGFDANITSPASLPVVPGQDFVGMIVARGKKARIFSMGERVAGLVRTGGNARFISVLETTVVNVPSEVETNDAVCMVSSYVTAYQTMKLATMKDKLFSFSGMRILIVGCMDGPGHALMEMCRKAKATVYAPAPRYRHDYIQSTLGVTPLPDDPSEWLTEVKGTIDLVFDGVCQDGMYASSQALNTSGKIIVFGCSSLLQQRLGLSIGLGFSTYISQFFAGLSTGAQFYSLWGSYQSNPDEYKKNLEALFQLLKWNKLRPIIRHTVSLDQVGKAMSNFDLGDMKGNVVCTPWKRVRKDHVHSMDNSDE